MQFYRNKWINDDAGKGQREVRWREIGKRTRFLELRLQSHDEYNL